MTTLTADREGGRHDVEVVALPRDPASTQVQVEIRQADQVVARELSLAVGTEVVSRHQELYIDGTLWSLQTVFYPMVLVVKGGSRLIEDKNIDEGAVEYLQNYLGIKHAGYRDNIAARPPDQHEAMAFNLPSDGRVPVVEILRTGFDQMSTRFRSL